MRIKDLEMDEDSILIISQSRGECEVQILEFIKSKDF